MALYYPDLHSKTSLPSYCAVWYLLWSLLTLSIPSTRKHDFSTGKLEGFLAPVFQMRLWIPASSPRLLLPSFSFLFSLVCLSLLTLPLLPSLLAILKQKPVWNPPVQTFPLCFLKKYLFICLCRVSGGAREIFFSCSMPTLS